MTQRLTDNQLATIRQRAESATNVNNAGWCVDDEYSDTVRVTWSYDLIAQCVPTKEDAQFIANARQDIPLLLAEIERLRAALSEIADIDDWDYGLEKAKDITFAAINEPEGWSSL